MGKPEETLSISGRRITLLRPNELVWLELHLNCLFLFANHFYACMQCLVVI
jgi:hypothetical protein